MIPVSLFQKIAANVDFIMFFHGRLTLVDILRPLIKHINNPVSRIHPSMHIPLGKYRPECAFLCIYLQSIPFFGSDMTDPHPQNVDFYAFIYTPVSVPAAPNPD